MKIVCNKDTKRGIITKQLQHIMIDYNIRSKDIVSHMGLTKGTVSNLLSPVYRPESSMTIDQLAVICDAMDCDLVLEIRKRD